MAKYKSRATRASEAAGQLTDMSGSLRELLDDIETACEKQVDGSTGPEWQAPEETKREEFLKTYDDIQGAVGGATEDIGGLADEMRSWEENMAEKFSSTDKYQRIDETASLMESVRDELESIEWPEFPSSIANQETWTDFLEKTDEIVDTLDNQGSEAEGGDFPGMYG